MKSMILVNMITEKFFLLISIAVAICPEAGKGLKKTKCPAVRIILEFCSKSLFLIVWKYSIFIYNRQASYSTWLTGTFSHWLNTRQSIREATGKLESLLLSQWVHTCLHRLFFQINDEDTALSFWILILQGLTEASCRFQLNSRHSLSLRKQAPLILFFFFTNSPQSILFLFRIGE